MRIAVSITIAFVSVLVAIGAEPAEGARRLSELEGPMAESFRTDAPEQQLNLVTKKLRREAPFHEKIPGREEPDTKITVLSANYYTVTKGAETNTVTILSYDSVEDASAWMRNLVRQIPVQPPVKIPNLGDEAVHFAGLVAGKSGSLYFRRSTIVVQIDTEKGDLGINLARITDKALKRALGSVDK